MPDELPNRIGMTPATVERTKANEAAVASRARTLPAGWAGLLGFLTLALAVPGLIATGLASAGVAVPAALTVVGAVCGSLATLSGAGAYWAAGGNPLELVPGHKPKPPQDSGGH